jgi:hypothetical protein
MPGMALARSTRQIEPVHPGIRMSEIISIRDEAAKEGSSFTITIMCLVSIGIRSILSSPIAERNLKPCQQ